MSYATSRLPNPLMTDEIPEIKPIRDIATGIALQSIIDVSTQSRQIRKQMAENLKIPWDKYIEMEAKILDHAKGI